ncbi:hypothetical protein HD593_008336 [Nonomuraea rubra]|uniref:Uncharacterized protein n=1 Tax=Nonomuraea rubra TaxID=46180 RepID=A0A7X0P1H1_9ACTN|nr:hypothetical protein [Nonomuraea rubra]
MRVVWRLPVKVAAVIGLWTNANGFGPGARPSGSLLM